MVKAKYLFPIMLLTCLGLTNVRLSGQGVAVASELETADVPIENKKTSTELDQVSPIQESTPLPVEEIPTEPNNVAPVPSNQEASILKPEVVPQEIESRLVLNLKERRVYIYQGDQQVAVYPVAVGKKGWETPTGDFTVMQMIPNPVWQNPWNGKIVPAGPKNPLGERWIGFWTDGKNYIGFHGTTAEHLIGQAVSHGCVRMRNSDIKAIFEQIKVGTRVMVVP